MSANTMFYEGLTNGNQYYNLCRDLSWMNSKNHEHSDRDGHVVGYICNVKVMGDASNLISSLPHLIRGNCVTVLENGTHIENLCLLKLVLQNQKKKGRYGKTIRPYLDDSMIGGTIKDPTGWNVSGTPPVQTQEWTYTQIAAAPGFDQNAVGTEGAAAVDVYELTLCGLNQSTATTLGTQYYTSVGMIHSYNPR